MTGVAIYSDIDIELNKQNDGDIQKDEDVEAVFNSLRNIVMTFQGQRRMRPDFAYGPYNFLFEPINEKHAQALGTAVASAINTYEPRIDLKNVNVQYSPEQYYYNVILNFVMLGRGTDTMTINYIIKRL
jgi:phage baseplate assembly protein W